MRGRLIKYTLEVMSVTATMSAITASSVKSPVIYASPPVGCVIPYFTPPADLTCLLDVNARAAVAGLVLAAIIVVTAVALVRRLVVDAPAAVAGLVLAAIIVVTAVALVRRLVVNAHAAVTILALAAVFVTSASTLGGGIMETRTTVAILVSPTITVVSAVTA